MSDTPQVINTLNAKAERLQAHIDKLEREGRAGPCSTGTRQRYYRPVRSA